jgi:hypothetical protein
MAWISSQGFRVNLPIKQSPIRFKMPPKKDQATRYGSKKYIGCDFNHLNDRVNVTSDFDMINRKT